MFIDMDTRAIVQGITGRVGRKQTRWMIEAGPLLVAGVTPGKEGQVVEGLPVYHTVARAVERHQANASVVFVPPEFVRDAAIEAMDAGLKTIVIVTEHIPVRDTMEISYIAKMTGTQVIGPNCPGIFVPGIGKLGIMPAGIFKEGRIGVVGRSATLSYEAIANLSSSNLGQSTAIGIGGDPVVCTQFSEVLEWFEADSKTTAIVMIGEIGGSAEQRAAEVIAKMNTPVVSLIAGRTMPVGKRFGHAGAIVQAGQGSADEKIQALRSSGVTIVDSPAEIPLAIKKVLAEQGKN